MSKPIAIFGKWSNIIEPGRKGALFPLTPSILNVSVAISWFMRTVDCSNRSIYGCLGAQSMPHHTPESIQAEIHHLVKDMSVGGGFILAPAKPIPSGIPVEIAAKMVETFLEQDGVRIV